jgi:probable phosphoglycerate mutase
MNTASYKYCKIHIFLFLSLVFSFGNSLSMISNVNKLQNISSLKNKFFALRHGQSLANIAKIISSDPSISTVEHGLSDEGKAQVSSSADKFAQHYLDNKDTQLVAIFSR